MINFTVGEDSYEFDDETMTVDEAREIKKYAGFGLKSWALGLQDMDPDALVGLVYLAKIRAGEAVRWSDLGSLNIGDIGITGGGSGDAAPPDLKSLPSSTSGRTRKK
jgi:hypothetical protein